MFGELVPDGKTLRHTSAKLSGDEAINNRPKLVNRRHRTQHADASPTPFTTAKSERRVKTTLACNFRLLVRAVRQRFSVRQQLVMPKYTGYNVRLPMVNSSRSKVNAVKGSTFAQIRPFRKAKMHGLVTTFSPDPQKIRRVQQMKHQENRAKQVNDRL